MALYNIATEMNRQNPTLYVVAYVNWLGVWVMDTQKITTMKSALAHSRKLAKTKAENGRVSVREVPSSRSERVD